MLKKNKIIFLFLFSFLFGLCFVVLAEASPVFEKLESSGGYTNIPADSDGSNVILCLSNGSMTLDGNAFTDIIDVQSANQGGGYGVTYTGSKLSYYKTFESKASQLVSSGGVYQCYYISGVNADDLVENSSVDNGYGTYDWGQGQNVSYPNAIEGNLVLNLFNTLAPVTDVDGYENLDSFSSYYSYFGLNFYSDWASQVATSSITNFAYADGFWTGSNPVNSYAFVELNFYNPPSSVVITDPVGSMSVKGNTLSVSVTKKSPSGL